MFGGHGQRVSAFETLVKNGTADVIGPCRVFGDSSGFTRHGAEMETFGTWASNRLEGEFGHLAGVGLEHVEAAMDALERAGAE